MSSKISDDSDDTTRQSNDFAITLILVVIWSAGLIGVAVLQPQIPKSMLAIGSVFFIVLIPAMKELVRSLERRSNGTTTDSAEGEQENT